MGLSARYTVLRTREDTSPRKGASHMYEIKSVRGHVEVYLDGIFCFSADTWGEAEKEIELMSA